MINMLGTLYIISAPSGAGKTSLIKELLQQVDKLELSVSHTTRAKRAAEIDGRDYHFIDKTKFQQMVGNHQFVEHAYVFDNFYGTSADHIQEDLDLGIDIILEIDWQGAEQVKQKFAHCISVFILPPSKDELYQRLKGRGQDSEQVIEGRMQQAVSEMVHYKQYDYIIVNDDFSVALEQLKSIMQSKRLEKDRQIFNHQQLIKDLLE
ncbi:MAG: guanylate kinase [Pseudomonadota bacterium]